MSNKHVTIMNYKELYRQIILTAKSEKRTRETDVYYESHHIIPDFMFINRKRQGPRGHLEGDPDSKSNIILLTFQEHILAHFYLYHSLKGTRYENSAGSALAFFFTKATDNKHVRWQSITNLDKDFLDEMAFMREIGVKSISDARKGKMPVVDAVTRQSIGSVAVDHPKVLSGEWIHHCKGKPGKKQPEGFGVGSTNRNYRPMTDAHRSRIMKLVQLSVVDVEYFSQKRFKELLKIEFSEFKRVSYRWILNNYATWDNLLCQYNHLNGTSIKNESYYRSSIQRERISEKNRGFCWVTDGVSNQQVPLLEIETFLKINQSFKRGRTIHAKDSKNKS